MKRTVPIHYLRPNHAVWTPPAIIAFDTETRWHYRDDDEIHELRLWSGRYVDRRPPKGKSAEDEWCNGLFAEDFALQVHKWCQQRRTVWAYAHNLTFDLMTTDLIGQLISFGWEVTDFAVDGGAPFCRLSRRDCTLTLCDSWSWLQTSIAEIGGAVGIPKPALPDTDDSQAAWLERCNTDVRILSEALLQLMAWWDACELGRWTITGAASGWNAMRHIPAPTRILIRPDKDECEADRQAIYGGRRYCWRTGELPPGRFAELDIERAYTVACRDLPLPVQRMARFANLPLDHKWLDCERHGVIARVLIETDKPRFPCRQDGRVWYPVGRFWTTLAGPDIRAARDAGCLREVGAGWVHELGYALRPWALWCIDAGREGAAGVPAVARIALRGWGRSVVGKWAQRGYERLRLGPAPTEGWMHGEAWHHNAGVKASIVDFGGQRWQVSATAESDNGYPGILAFVESYVRCALSAAISAIGERALVSCDTDGLIMDAGAALRARGQLIRHGVAHPGATDPLSAVILAGARAAEPFRLRDKRTWHKVTVLGPQHLMTDEQRRLAGIPGQALKQPDGTLHAWLWPKLAWQMRHGRAGEYVRPSQSYRLAAVYAPGWVLADGAVLPVELTAVPGAGNVMRPWPLTRHAQAGAVLGPAQHRALERLRVA